MPFLGGRVVVVVLAIVPFDLEDERLPLEGWAARASAVDPHLAVVWKDGEGGDRGRQGWARG